MAMTPAEFQARLDAISEHKGVPYGRAHLLFDMEKEHGRKALQYKGYLALSDAFKCHFLEAVELFNTTCCPAVTTPLSAHYGWFLMRLAQSFQSICGAERIALKGYPLHACTILRNTLDNIILTSAAVQKVTDFYSIEGVVPGVAPELNAIKKLRKKTEFDVREVMTGSKSGLTQATIGEIRKWDEVFDFEVHGARLSMAGNQDWLSGRGPLLVLPTFREQEMAMFMNRSSEMAWMIHRLLPLIQPDGAPLPAIWHDKWRVLDESFSLMVNSLTQEGGKAIGAAFVELINAKFRFNEKSAFPL